MKMLVNVNLKNQYSSTYFLIAKINFEKKNFKFKTFLSSGESSKKLNFLKILNSKSKLYTIIVTIISILVLL